MATATVAPPTDAATRATGEPEGEQRFGGVHGSRVTPYLFLLPYLLLFATFFIVPAVFGIWISLHNWDFLLPGKPFVGLDNYTALFDPCRCSSTVLALDAGNRDLHGRERPFLVAIPLGWRCC